MHFSKPLMKKTINEKKQIRTFGIGLVVFLSSFGAIKYYKTESEEYFYLFIASFIILCLSIIKPYALKHIYKGAMFMAHVLGWINTRIILSIIFFFIFSPIGIVLRLIKKDLLNRKIDSNCATYWQKRTKVTFEKSHCERQF